MDSHATGAYTGHPSYMRIASDHNLVVLRREIVDTMQLVAVERKMRGAIAVGVRVFRRFARKQSRDNQTDTMQSAHLGPNDATFLPMVDVDDRRAWVGVNELC